MKIFTSSKRNRLSYTSNKEHFTFDGKNGAEFNIKCLNTTATPADASLTHTCTTALIPAGSIVFGVACRVLSPGVLASSATWSVGVSGATTRYGTTVARTAGTTTTVANFLANTYPLYYQSETALVLTSSSGNWGSGAGGSIRICIWYATVTAPTS